MQVVNTLLLTIIAVCSIAFIKFEYQPSVESMPEIERIITIQKLNPNNPDCLSNLYTNKYKKDVLGCTLDVR